MPSWIDIYYSFFAFLTLLFFMTKILGKKQISELSFFEYVSGITIGSIAGEAITGLEKNMFQGMAAIIIFSLVTLLVDIFALKSKSFRDFIDGRGTVLIKDGKVLEENLKKENTPLMNYLPYSARKIFIVWLTLNLLYWNQGERLVLY